MATRQVVITGTATVNNPLGSVLNNAYLGDRIKQDFLANGWSINYVQVTGGSYFSGGTVQITIDANVDNSFNQGVIINNAAATLAALTDQYCPDPLGAGCYLTGIYSTFQPFSNIALAIYKDAGIVNTQAPANTPKPTPIPQPTQSWFPSLGSGNQQGGNVSGNPLNNTVGSALANSLGISTPALVVGGIAATLFLIVYLEKR